MGWGSVSQTITPDSHEVDIQPVEGSMRLASLAFSGNGQTHRLSARVGARAASHNDRARRVVERGPAFSQRHVAVCESGISSSTAGSRHLSAAGALGRTQDDLNFGASLHREQLCRRLPVGAKLKKSRTANDSEDLGGIRKRVNKA